MEWSARELSGTNILRGKKRIRKSKKVDWRLNSEHVAKTLG